MAFSQLLMKLCHTVDITLPKGIGGTSKIMKSKVGRHLDPPQILFGALRMKLFSLGRWLLMICKCVLLLRKILHRMNDDVVTAAVHVSRCDNSFPVGAYKF